MRVKGWAIGVFAIFLAGILQAAPRWHGPDDPLLGYILTDEYDKALKEINLRIEASTHDEIQKNELLLQKVSIYLKKQEPKAALKTLAQVSADYFQNYDFQYKSWLVYWEILKQTKTDDQHFKGYQLKARDGLAFTLANASQFNTSMVERANNYLKAYPDAKLSEEISDRLAMESGQNPRSVPH